MKRKSGLILEGGGMRGIFTAGVLDSFLENNINFNNVIGVSAGACHACSFLSKQHKRAFSACADYINDKRYCSLYSLITTGDIFGVDFVYNEIPNKLNIFDNKTFLKNKTNFEAVVTNCKTGKPEYFKVKDMEKDIVYIRASSSLPFVSRMVTINNNEYLDGGISDSIPLQYYLNKKVQKIVIVLTRPFGYRKKPTKYTRIMKIKYKNYPELLNSIKTRYVKYNKTIELIEKLEQEGKIFVIRPPHTIDLGRIEKNHEKLENTYSLGYETANNRIEELIKFLK